MRSSFNVGLALKLGERGLSFSELSEEIYPHILLYI
jgi:hypothetical protein